MFGRGHDLPSADLLSEFTGFFKSARVEPNGSCTVVISLSPEAKPALLDISSGDGMAINFTCHYTDVPEGAEALLAAMGGLGDLFVGRDAGDDGG